MFLLDSLFPTISILFEQEKDIPSLFQDNNNQVLSV